MFLKEQTYQDCERLSILGTTADGAFSIKKTAQGYRCFVKIKSRWRNAPSAGFHHYVPGGLSAEVRIFTFDPVDKFWVEVQTSVSLWHPEVN